MLSPTGIILAAAYAGKTVGEAMEAAMRHGYTAWRFEKTLTRLLRQGNVAVDGQGRLYIPDTAHRLTPRMAESAAKALGWA